MAIEWVAISAAVIPRIRKYASDRGGEAGRKYADGVLAKIYSMVVPKANEAFVSRFSKELDSTIDLATLNAERYQEALKLFLSSPTVQDLLQAPLDGRSELEWEVLRGIWSELPPPVHPTSHARRRRTATRSRGDSRYSQCRSQRKDSGRRGAPSRSASHRAS